MAYEKEVTVFEFGDEVLINGVFEGKIAGFSDCGHVAVKTERDELIHITHDCLTLKKSRSKNIKEVYNMEKDHD